MDHHRQRLQEVKRRNKPTENKVRRSCSRTYRLPNDEMYSIKIICIPILHRTNLPLDKRGKHDTLHKILVHKILVHKKSKIQLHIESFNPAVTHYRRAHAPLRSYLPAELTIRLMFSDFKGKNPEVQCSERRFSR